MSALGKRKWQNGAKGTKKPKGVVGAKNRGYLRNAGFYGRFQGKGAEHKFFDTALSFLIDITGEVPATGQLTLIPQGVTESTRIGRKCVVTSIYVKGAMKLDPTTNSDASPLATILLVLDKQCNGAAATATDVMTGTNFVTAVRNLSNSERFTVLKQWMVPFNVSGGVAGAYNTMNVPFGWYKKCNIPIDYSATSGAIGTIRSNNLFLLASTSGDGDDIIAIDGTCRLRFTDN